MQIEQGTKSFFSFGLVSKMFEDITLKNLFKIIASVLNFSVMIVF